MSKHVKDDEVVVSKRGAVELSALLKAHPEWTNELDHLDALEEAAGLEVTPWVTDPVNLMDEVRALSTRQIGEGSNYI